MIANAGVLRRDWFEASRGEEKRLFSELETLLKSLDRFFFLEPSPNNRNFDAELMSARDVIMRVQLILEALIPDDVKNEHRFHKYAEASLMRGRKRDLFRQEILKQDTPEKGLLLLYDSFINMRRVAEDLLRNKNISYSGFRSFGQMMGSRIRGNAFFNPFAPGVNANLDVIENSEISGIVKKIYDRDLKKAVSSILFHIFLFLRHLSHADLANYRRIVLSCSLLIVLLLKPEMGMLVDYMEKSSKRLRNKKFAELLRLMTYQFSMDTKRVYVQEMKEVFGRPPLQMWARVDVSHGILKNLLEHTAIQIAQFFKPGIKGEDIFESFITKAELSATLREDVYTFDMLVTMLLENAGKPEKAQQVFKVLKNYGEHFEGLTLKLIRFDDYEELASFLESLKKVEFLGSGYDALLEKCGYFKVFLDTLFGHISNRAELHGKPLDAGSAEDTVRLLLKTASMG